MKENDLSGLIVDICLNIHKKLGPGLFESIYEEILVYELANNGISFSRQVPIPVFWKNIKLNIGFRADLIIENKLILEIKSTEHLAPVHYKQLLTYLKLTDIRLGLLINFNEALIKDGIRRVVNGY
ncbi:MAG: GxxExxY protein [Balneolaceae bacterium]|nr:MAG: GxxExxY protein [Balneolaceae bacterium]